MGDDRIRLVAERSDGWVTLRGATPLDTKRFNERFAARNWCVPMRQADLAPTVLDFDLLVALDKTFGPDVAVDISRRMVAFVGPSAMATVGGAQAEIDRRDGELCRAHLNERRGLTNPAFGRPTARGTSG